jgi:hypothetical protein
VGVADPSGLAVQDTSQSDVEEIEDGVDSSVEASAKDTGPGADLDEGLSSKQAKDKIPERVWRNLSEEQQIALSTNLEGYLSNVKQQLGASGEISRISPVDGAVEAGMIVQQHDTGEYSTNQSVWTTVTVEKEYTEEVTYNVTKTKTKEVKEQDGWHYKTAVEKPIGWALYKSNVEKVEVPCTNTGSGWNPSYEACHFSKTESQVHWKKPDGTGWTKGGYKKTAPAPIQYTTESTSTPGPKWSFVEDTGDDKKVTEYDYKYKHKSPGSGWDKLHQSGSKLVPVTTWEYASYSKWDPGKRDARAAKRNCNSLSNWKNCRVVSEDWGDYGTVFKVVGSQKTTTSKRVPVYKWEKKTTVWKDINKYSTVKLKDVKWYEWTRTTEKTRDTTQVWANKYRTPNYKTVTKEVEYNVTKTKDVTKTKNVTKSKLQETEMQVSAVPFTHKGNVNWTFARDVTQTRDSTMTVSGAALAYNVSDALHLQAVDESGDVWWLRVRNDSTTGDIIVKTSTGLEETYSGDQIRIDFDAGTINGDNVGLQVGTGLDEPYKLGFRNGEGALGAYRFITDGYPKAGTDYSEDISQPNVSVAGSVIFSATFDVTYETDETVYTDRVTIQPTVNLEEPASPADEEPVFKPDADDDGVPNEADECPTTPGTPEHDGCDDSGSNTDPPGGNECPTNEGPSKSPCQDKDDDGISDDEDACPDRAGPERYGGCPDTDNDGVPDMIDECPFQSGAKSNAGCPITGGGY